MTTTSYETREFETREHQSGKIVEKGPIAKNLNPGLVEAIRKQLSLNEGDAVFFVCGEKAKAEAFAGVVRTRICDMLDLAEKNAFRFCWVVESPMSERTPETGGIEFSHNPFSMPQGGLAAELDASR